jgi:hypothetical protein
MADMLDELSIISQLRHPNCKISLPSCMEACTFCGLNLLILVAESWDKTKKTNLEHKEKPNPLFPGKDI